MAGPSPARAIDVGPFEAMEVEGRCPRHGPFTQKVVRAFGRRLSSACPKCCEEREREELARKAGGKAGEAALLAAANIEPEFYGATLDSFRAGTESQARALAAVRELCAKRSGAVVLSGGSGVGKTHLACAAARELGGAVYAAFEISLRIRGTYSAGARETEEGVLRELCSLPFLAIDDLGRGRTSCAEQAWLFHIIDKRLARRLPTMAATCLPLARQLPESRYAESAEAALGEGATERLLAGGKAIFVCGPNMRRARGAAL